MTQNNWTKATGFIPADWTTAADWSLGHVPTSSEDAFVGSNSGSAAVISTANQTVNSLATSSNDTVGIGGGSVFTATHGTGPNGNNGTIEVQAATFVIDQSVVNNSGTIEINSGNSNILTALEINGAVTIDSGVNGQILLAKPGGSGLTSTAFITTGGTGTLNLDHGLLHGTGNVGNGNANMALNNVSGIIDADDGYLLLDTGTHTINNSGLLESTSGILLIDSPVNNSGIILVDGGFMAILSHVLSTGAIEIGEDSFLEVEAGASVSGNVFFIGTDAVLDAFGSIGGDIVGAAAGDSIGLPVAFAAGEQAAWQQTSSAGGTLSLVNNAGTLASVNLAGQYVAAQFSVIQTSSSAAIEIINPPPPAGTTADMILSNSGNYEIYDIGGNAILAAYHLVWPLGNAQGPEWGVSGLGGFNGTDTTDMILRDSLSGDFQVADISNNNVTKVASLGQVGVEWTVAGFGDFSGKAGETDMMMRNTSTGALEVYDISNNAITSSASMGQVGVEWKVAGFGDFSGKAGETDMLMRNTSTGALEVYDISNNAITSSASMGQVGVEWAVAGFGDFSGNANETDMLMRNSTTGAFELYDIGNNAITSSASIGQVGTEWQVAGFGPLNGAGTSDMVMRNTNNGAFEVYDIANNALTTATSMGQAGLAWQVAGIAVDPPSTGSAATVQLAQAMASFGSSAGADGAASAIAGAAGTSQYPDLAAPPA